MKRSFLFLTEGISVGEYFASVYTEFDGSVEDAQNLFEEYYKDHPFVHVSAKPVHLKQVVNTNKCVVSLIKHNGMLLINSAIDNLLKGASGSGCSKHESNVWLP